MKNKTNRELSSTRISFDQEVHLADYLNIIWKRKWIAITFFIVVVCVVAVKTYYTKPEYLATAQISIKDISSPVKGMAQVSEMVKTGFDTQCELLKGSDIVRKICENLQLEEYVTANKEKPNVFTSMLNRIQGFIRKSLNPASSDAPQTLHSSLKKTRENDEEELLHQQWVVNWYLSKLMITPIPKTSLVNISFSDHSPEMAARIANLHAKTFVERNNQLRIEASRNTFNWLRKELREQKLKVEKSDLAINKFAFEELNFHSVDSDSFFALPEVKDHFVIQDLRRQLVKLKTNKMEMNTKFGPKHPKIIEIDSSINQVKKSIVDEANQLKETIRIELERAAVAVVTEKHDMGEQKPQVDLHDQEKFTNYGMLQLEAESDKEIYDILLKQAKEIDLTGSVEGNNISIVDAAVIPRRPIKPNVIFNLLLSIVMGLVFGVGFTFFFEYMDKTLRTPDDIMQYLELPVLGLLPYNKHFKKTESLVLPTNGTHLKLNEPPKERGKNRASYYNVTSNIISGLPFVRSGISGQVLLFESATAGEGKSTVLANSALNLAKGGLRVAMVDADMQRPSLHIKFGLDNGNVNGLLNIMTRILSTKIDHGNLDSCSIDDLFFLISLKKQSGKLIVKDDSQTMTAVFENGRLIHIQSQEVPFANRLGTMLLRGGFIDENQLKDALDRNERTGQPIGYILINSGYINQSKLQGPLKLQIEEHLHKLFSWKQGNFVFESGYVETYEDRRIHFEEDYSPIISRLGRMAGSRLVENEVLSCLKSIEGLNLSLLTGGMDDLRNEGPQYFAFLTKVLDILKQRFDVVLVDAPPLLDTIGSVRSLLQLVDGVIFVVKSGHATVKMVNQAANYLKESDANVVGAVLNQSKKDSGYNYYR